MIVGIYTLQEICGTSSHPGVNIGFRGLDVVVEVVTEGLDV
jgi:hypothetical protein